MIKIKNKNKNKVLKFGGHTFITCLYTFECLKWLTAVKTRMKRFT